MEQEWGTPEELAPKLDLMEWRELHAYAKYLGVSTSGDLTQIRERIREAWGKDFGKDLDDVQIME